MIVISSVFSCANLPGKTIPDIPEPKPEPETEEDTLPPLVEKHDLPEFIMSAGMISAENLALFLLQNNPELDKEFALTLAEIYTEEAAFEGVNHDIAFVQMCLETGFLQYGGDVKPEQFNYAGMGAIGGGEPGLSFPEPRIGVRAQMQHLKAYGCEEPLNGELVNPRFRFVKRGISPTYEGLAGTWAADKQYAEKIKLILQRLYDFSFVNNI
jgi:hypothetical protein